MPISPSSASSATSSYGKRFSRSSSSATGATARARTAAPCRGAARARASRSKFTSEALRRARRSAARRSRCRPGRVRSRAVCRWRNAGPAMSKCAHGPSPANWLQELGGEHRAALAQLGGVLHVGEVGVDVAAVARVEREAARRGRRSSLRRASICAAQASSFAEPAGVQVAERDRHGAGQRGEVDDVRRACSIARSAARRRERACLRRRC